MINDKRRSHEGERRIDERLGGHSDGTTGRADDAASTVAESTEIRHVYATTYLVRSRRGGDRLQLLVACWLCGRTHQHSAPVGWTSGLRTTGCSQGRYRLHVDAIVGEVAATSGTGSPRLPEVPA
jgi:hypothetical protein